jgi:hypothetical protein
MLLLQVAKMGSNDTPPRAGDRVTDIEDFQIPERLSKAGEGNRGQTTRLPILLRAK